MKIFELRNLLNEKRKARKALVDNAEAENRELTEAEETQFADHSKSIESIEKRVTRLEQASDAAGDDDDDQADDDQADDDKPRRRSLAPAIDRAGSGSGPAIHTRKHEYSILRAIRGLSDKTRPRLTGLEAEYSREISIRSGNSPRGFYVPHSLGIAPDKQQKRALNVTTGAGAIGMVTESTLIEYLYNKTLLIQAGATVLTDMEGKFALPRQSGTATATWVAESGSATESSATIDQVVFDPKTITANTTLSRKFINQATYDGELLVRNDLARLASQGIDRAGYLGASGNEPAGLLNNPNIGNVSTGTNGGPVTWQSMIDLETAVAAANADLGKLAYITSAKGRGCLKGKVKTTGYPEYLWQDNEINGYAAYATQQIPDTFTQGSGTGLSAIIFGNWAELIITLFGALDVLVDPYTAGNSGSVKINIFQDADINPRHPGSFAKCIFNPAA